MNGAGGDPHLAYKGPAWSLYDTRLWILIEQCYEGLAFEFAAMEWQSHPSLYHTYYSHLFFNTD